MINYMNNQYNPYTEQYINPTGLNVAYQPVYDQSETDRWANLLQERSQRYDIGKQNTTDFESQLGGIQTYDPEYVTERINQFHTDIKDMVNTQYGGDYGLAAGDIAQKIAKEKGNKAYKLMDFQNKQAEEFLQAKRKAGVDFITKKDIGDPTRPGLLRQAMEAKDPYSLLQADYAIRPDRVTLANKLIETVNPSGWQSILQDLDQSERDQLKKAGIVDPTGLFKQVQYQGVSEETLNKLKDKFANLLVNQDRSLGYEFGDDAKNKALEIIDQAIPLHVWNKSGEDLQNLGDKSKSSADVNQNGTILTHGAANVSNIAKEQTYVRDTYGENKVDLDKPEKQVTRESGITPGMPSTYTIGDANEVIEYNKKLREGHAKIKDFEQNTGMDEDQRYSNKTNQQKLEIAAEYEDAYNAYSNERLMFEMLPYPEQHIENLNRVLKTGVPVAPKKMDGTPITDLNDVSGSLWWKKGREDFDVLDIDPQDGMVVARNNKDGEEIKFYPSSQAQARGNAIKQFNNNLKSNGFSVNGEFGVPILSVAKVFNRKDPYTATSLGGGYRDYVVAIPEKYIEDASKIQNKEEALDLFDRISKESVPMDNQSFLIEYATTGLHDLGYTKRKK